MGEAGPRPPQQSLHALHLGDWQFDYKQSLFNDLMCNYFKDAKYQDFIANLTPSIYHFAGWKPEKVCTDDPPKWEPCNLYKFYARKICSD